MFETNLTESFKPFLNQAVAKSVCSGRKGICYLSINAFVVAIEKLRSLKETEAKLIDLYSEGGKRTL